MAIDFQRYKQSSEPRYVLLPSREATYIAEQLRSANIFYNFSPVSYEDDIFTECVDSLKHYEQFYIYAIDPIILISPFDQQVIDNIFKNLATDDDYIDYRVNLSSDDTPATRKSIINSLTNPMPDDALNIFNQMRDRYRDTGDLITPTLTPNTWFPVVGD